MISETEIAVGGESKPSFPSGKIHTPGFDLYDMEILVGRRRKTWFSLKSNVIKLALEVQLTKANLPTCWQVVMRRLFDITPNSSTLEAKKTQVGANSKGSMHLNEFRT